MMRHNSLPAMLTLSLLALLSSGAVAAAAEVVSVAVPVGPYQITEAQGGQDLQVEGFGRLLVPGKPVLPSKIFAVALPPGAEFVNLTYEAGDGVVLPGTYQIAPAPLFRVIGTEKPQVLARRQAEYDQNYRSVYEGEAVYPHSVVEFVRTAGYRQYNLVDVRVTPLTWKPSTGHLTYYPQITVHLNYRLPPQPLAPVVDNLARPEQFARRLILNHQQAQDWYPSGPAATRGLNDYVIITLDSLTSSVTPLVNWETTKGRTVHVATTTWIAANYTGYDLAEQMRNFLRDKLSPWGIEDVLLVGHYDDVPMRRTAQNLGYGAPETDFYYAELSLPDDQSWDDDEDHQWGEDTDPIDYYAEVNVGRIPWSTPATVLSICNKSVAYEQNNDPTFKKNMLLLGGFFWNDDPNPRTDNAELMEAKVDQTWMADWTLTRMYEQNVDCYSTYPCDYELLHANVMSVWPTGKFAFVNWAGHGSPTSCHIYGIGAPAFISTADCSSLDDDYPAIIFADACSNSDTDNLNLGQAMIQQGAVGFVGATKVALGCPGWNDPYDGSSQSMDYFFTTRVTSGDHTQGQAHQLTLTDMYNYGLWSYNKYETFEWGALWGNPNLSMAPSMLSISFPEGLPEYVEPGVATTITVRIQGGMEDYVPGTGTLHYRYDGGTYLTSALVHDTGDDYLATLPPATCSDNPEYYFSAQGTVSGVITSPPTAPSDVYTATVGELMVYWEDTFASNPGWTTEGDWAFGTPTGGGGEYGGPDPTSGHTGSNVYGYNLSGDYANNLPERDLTSTAIDCTGLSDVHLKFWRWLGVEQPTYDHAYVRVSNNGSNWTTVWQNTSEVTDTSWQEMDLDISTVADGQSSVYLRWTMGETDGGWRYCGWNIDDVQLVAFVCQDDADGDNVPDAEDNCPFDYNPGQEDGDGDEVGDACDGCPADPNKTEPGVCGCGVPDTDTDGDQTPDCIDGCPADPNKTEPGVCGCGVPDTDTDGDDTPDCVDACPNEPALTEPEGPTENNCADGVDNDCDGDTDGADPDCGPTECTCGDVNSSGGPVDLEDFAYFANCFGLTGPMPPECEPEHFACSDLDGDGEITLVDFGTFALWFGDCGTCSPPDCMR